MGGKNNENYKRFTKKSIELYIYLRKHAKLIINLFQLMLDAEIKVFNHLKHYQFTKRSFSSLKDLNLEALQSMCEKFKLYDSDEGQEHFKETLEKSVEALFPVVTDTIHILMGYLRK